ADRVRYVKSLLLFQGYGRLEFHRLPNHGEEGSREILLAFSWLLHKMKILEILLEKKRVKVGDHITICLCSQDMSIQKCKDMSSSTKEDADFRFLQWLNGKLRFCWRALYASHLEECAVLYKVRKCLFHHFKLPLFKGYTAIPASRYQPSPTRSHTDSDTIQPNLTIVYMYSIPHSPSRHTVHISSPFTFCITPLFVVCKLVGAGPSPLLSPSIDYFM
ncbi:hypothetical protein GDO78_021923, partial [Eleutherodactylus coqui]